MKMTFEVPDQIGEHFLSAPFATACNAFFDG